MFARLYDAENFVNKYIEFNTNLRKDIPEIYDKIKEHFSKSDDTIGIYEERPWKEIVFVFNFHKQNMDYPPLSLNYLNNPIIWPARW